MNSYRVDLWFMLRKASGLPTVDVEASSEIEAAALAIQHFRSGGQKLQLSEWKMTVKEMPDGIEHSYYRDSVIGWLTASRQRKFVQHNLLADVVR